MKTYHSIIFLLFLPFFLPTRLNAQDFCLEDAYAYYYSGDYKTGMTEINKLINSSKLSVIPQVEQILYCGMLCCDAYSKQLQLQLDIKDLKKWNAITAQQQQVWDIELHFFELLENICNIYLEAYDDIKSKHHYLIVQINSTSLIAKEAVEKKFQRRVKSLCRKYVKEVLPHLQKSGLDLSEIFEGYNIVMMNYAEDNDIKHCLDCMVNYIEPWFLNSVINNPKIGKINKLTMMRQYKTLVNIMNYGLEGEFSPSNEYISSVMDLNIRATNMSFFLKGSSMYESYLYDGWRKIQEKLDESSAAVLFCNAKAEDEHIFAFVVNSKSKYPKLEYCGHSYWVGRDVFGINHFMRRDGVKEYTNVYYSPTEEMAFLHIAQNTSFHRLHSLSELLMPVVEANSSPLICTFSDINYTLGDSKIYDSASNKGAETTEKLIGAKEELNYLQKNISSKKLIIFNQDEATKEAFKSISNQNFDILHVSSHAYYNTGQSRKDSNSDLLSSIDGTSIMNNCGIKLSGYNDDEKKGVITATEIASLNLSHVSIVILDACETGIGDVRGGDIYSLAEAFHIAGVRYVMATTAKIEDKDACGVFIQFMKKMLNGQSYHDAFHMALQASSEPNKYILWE